MKSTIKERTDTEVTLEVTIDSNTVNQKLDEIYNKTVQELDIPGFRKGNVPKSFVKARFGDDVFYEDAQEELVEEFLPKALEENSLDPVSQPKTKIEEFERDEDFTFEASLEILPELKLDEYTGIEVQDTGTEEVTEEEIEEKLAELQEQNGQLVPKDEEEVESEDYIVVSTPEGGTDQVQVTEENRSSEFLGKTVGDEVELSSGPEGEEEDAVQFTVEDIKQLDLPPIDDELAKDLGHEDLESLRTEIKSDLFSQKEEERAEELGDRIVDKILDSTDFSPPEKMIKKMADDQLSQTKEQMGAESFSELLKEKGKSEEEVTKDIEESTRERFKRKLILDEIAELEGIEVTDEELEEELEAEADRQGVNPIKLKNQLRANDRLESYRETLIHEKVVDFLIDSANLISEEDNNE
ncbi:MAG: trigger factor [Candidatus Bipolaricaulota bacterium]